MKNKSGSRIGRLFGRIFNIRLWTDAPRMKAYTLYLWTGAKNLFVPNMVSSSSPETFNAAKNKFKLTEADLILKEKSLFRLSLLMVLMAILVFIYGIYQLCYGNFLSATISMVVMAIAVTLAFRYHFWYFQIKRRKLGCTIHEWFRQGLMGDKS